MPMVNVRCMSDALPGGARRHRLLCVLCSVITHWSRWKWGTADIETDTAGEPRQLERAGPATEVAWQDEPTGVGQRCFSGTSVPVLCHDTLVSGPAHQGDQDARTNVGTVEPPPAVTLSSVVRAMRVRKPSASPSMI